MKMIKEQRAQVVDEDTFYSALRIECVFPD